jgi:large subunit ribosomal protein L6
MSRIGKKPIQLPDMVKFSLNGNVISVKGPKGNLERQLHPAIKIDVNDNVIEVKADTSNTKAMALQGLFRSLIFNMVTGVSTGYEKKLVLSGIGYRAETSGQNLILNVGFSNPVNFTVPEGITASLESNTQITLSGIDKELLGQVSANVRSIRPPEPYKGKGIMYADEKIIKKAGKTAGKD